MSEPQHVTVKVWSGGNREDYDDIVARDPEEYELEVHGEDTYHVPHDDHAMVAEEMENHGRYAFMVAGIEEAVELHVETNDSYHQPKEGFNNGTAIERGLHYAPEGHDRHPETPFKCEIWGRIRMRVEVA